MPEFQIKSEHIAGFVAEKPEPGSGRVKVCVKAPLITSDEPEFYILITEISKTFFNKIQFPTDFIYRFLIILHNDDTADIFINDFTEVLNVKVSRDVKEGEVVYVKDIDDIAQVRLPNIEIKPDDAVLYCRKIGWKFGLSFDFSRKVNSDDLSGVLGALVKKLFFEKDITAADIELREIEKEQRRDVLIITEGKTDWKHLKKAAEKLKFELPIKFLENIESDLGDDYIFGMCEYYAKIPNHAKTIFIFDRDNPKILRKLEERTAKGTAYQDWGNNTFSFCIPKPSHREKYKNISIEFYYTDDEIRTIDGETGKRVFFTNEIEERGIKSVTKKTYTSNLVVLDKAKDEEELEKKIYGGEVDAVRNEKGVAVAHSKEVFASNVLNDKPDFDSFNFDEFQKIFKIISDIIQK
jgi:hypothetical protein